jgi:hypothetical protein
MNRKAMAPLLLGAWLLGCVAPLALGVVGCGADAELMGTETGNPPGIDTRRLRLEWTEGGVELIGDAGAVPAGSEVQLRNSRTGESVTGTANADGSVRLSVQGSASDPYEVTVSSGGGQTTAPLLATDATMSGPPLDDGALPGGMPACESLEVALAQAVTTTFNEAPRECNAHIDCTALDWSVGCFSGSCQESAIATSSVEATQALAEQRVGSICADLERCNQTVDTCDKLQAFGACVDGGCELRYFDEQLSCEDVSNEANLRRTEVLENAERACTVDADCALVDLSVRCLSDCSFRAAVASSGATQVQSDVEQIESLFCGESEVVGCPRPPELPCPQPGLPRAICALGRCEVASAGDPNP